MLAQTVFWLLTGIFTQYSAGSYINILLIANGILFAILAFISYKNTITKAACLIFLTANTVLTLTDQAGIYDYVILAVNILLIIFFALSIIQKKTSDRH